MTQTLSIAALFDTIVAIFAKAGLSPDQAAAVARTVTAGERDACKSHGIYRIEGCLRTVKAGKVNPLAEPTVTVDGAIVRVDAQGGFAPLAFERGAPVLAETARRHGLAAMAIGDCVHFSALWPELEQLTAQGLAALAMCPSYSSVAPAGGIQALLGTNPLAFGWPRPGNPYVFDFATSVVARGEVELHRRAGKPIPEGWAIDAEGAATTDPTAALAGALLPFGGHKGSAISTMIELLAAAMIGENDSVTARKVLGDMTLSPTHGELVLAFDPRRFTADPFTAAEALLEAIAGQGARLPSQRRFAARAAAETEGITLTPDETARLERFLSLGLDAV